MPASGGRVPPPPGHEIFGFSLCKIARNPAGLEASVSQGVESLRPSHIKKHPHDTTRGDHFFVFI